MQKKVLDELIAAGKTEPRLLDTPIGPVEVQIPIGSGFSDAELAAIAAEQVGRVMQAGVAQAQNPQAEGGVAGAVGGRPASVMANLLRGAA